MSTLLIRTNNPTPAWRKYAAMPFTVVGVLIMTLGMTVLGVSYLLTGKDPLE